MEEFFLEHKQKNLALLMKLEMNLFATCCKMVNIDPKIQPLTFGKKKKNSWTHSEVE